MLFDFNRWTLTASEQEHRQLPVCSHMSSTNCECVKLPPGVSITPSVKLNPATGLSTSYSTLQYAATKEDAGAVFTCVSTYELVHNETQLEPLPVHCE